MEGTLVGSAYGYGMEIARVLISCRMVVMVLHYPSLRTDLKAVLTREKGWREGESKGEVLT